MAFPRSTDEVGVKRTPADVVHFLVPVSFDGLAGVQQEWSQNLSNADEGCS